MSNFNETLKSLLPNGVAFRIFKGTKLQKIVKALSKMPDEVRAHIDSVRDAGIVGKLPSQSLGDWEKFLNLKHNSSLSDNQRQERIAGRISTVGGQGSDYIKNTFHNAGFQLYVYENLVSGVNSHLASLGNFQLGDVQLGEFTDRIDPRSVSGYLCAGAPTYKIENDMVVDNEQPTIPPIADRYIYVWFLTGPGGIDDVVDIPIERKQDFFELLFKIKPLHTWCIAQVNFV